MNLRRLKLPVIALLIAGCTPAPEGPPLVPVAGTITLNGKPLAAADLMFVPDGSTQGQGGVAQTDKDGHYALQSHDRKHPGAPVGSYRVIINKLVKPDGSDYVPDPTAGPIDTGGFRELLPAAYSDMGLTQLTATVPEAGAKTLNFQLNSRAK